MALDDIYKEVILDHYKSPRNKRELPGAELQCHANNPLCGDEITVFAHLDGDSVQEVTFQGAGCSISQSSASMMTEAVTGRQLEDAKALAADFRGMMAGELERDRDGNEDQEPVERGFQGAGHDRSLERHGSAAMEAARFSRRCVAGNPTRCRHPRAPPAARPTPGWRT